MHREESHTVQVKGPTTWAVETGMEKNGLIPGFIHRSSVTCCRWEVQRIGSEKTRGFRAGRWVSGRTEHLFSFRQAEYELLAKPLGEMPRARTKAQG